MNLGWPSGCTSRKFVEAHILDDLKVPVSDLWRLLTTTHMAYAKNYG